MCFTVSVIGPERGHIELWCCGGVVVRSCRPTLMLSLPPPDGHREGEGSKAHTQVAEWTAKNLHERADGGRTKASLGRRMWRTEQSEFLRCVLEVGHVACLVSRSPWRRCPPHCPALHCTCHLSRSKDTSSVTWHPLQRRLYSESEELLSKTMPAPSFI